MKQAIKFLAIMSMMLIAIVASGAVDITGLVDLPSWIKPEDGIALAAFSIAVTPDTLNKSAQKYRKDILVSVLLGLERSTMHMTVRPGITYKETVGEMAGTVELAPFKADSGPTDKSATIKGRTLETHRGQVYDRYNLKSLISTIYGMDMTANAKVENFDINQKILMYVANQVSGKLNLHIFDAVRDDAGDATEDLFNGFDTITAADIVAGNVSVAKGNEYDFTEAIDNTNAVDLLKAMYRAASDELQSKQTKLVMPFAVYNAYNDDYQATVGAAPYNKEFQKTFLEGSSNMCELVPLVGKKDSPYLNLTTRKNMLVGTDQMSDMENVRVKEDNNVNLTQFILEMFFGVQFETVMKEELLVGKVYST